MPAKTDTVASVAKLSDAAKKKALDAFAGSLFDLLKAEKSAQLAIGRKLHEVEAWFVAQESADDFLAWAVETVQRGEGSIRGYMNAVTTLDELGDDAPEGIKVEALVEIAKVKDHKARVRILKATGGNTTKTREAVKKYRDSKKPKPSAEAAAKKRQDKVDKVAKAIRDEARTIFARVPTEGYNASEVLAFGITMFALGSRVSAANTDRSEIDSDAFRDLVAEWLEDERAKSETAAGLDSSK